jgi:4-amino-4-deoxy-L-arabinose transferase-like glycosyltransferase
MRAIFRRLPNVAWVCALITVLNGAAWSIITPPFQGRDEPDHFAYVQQLAETGTLPRAFTPGSPRYSRKETLVLIGLHQEEVRFRPQVQAISSVAEQRALMRYVKQDASSTGPGSAGLASSEPPLYYALETIPYGVGNGNVLTQLELMRLLSALMGGVTTLLIFLFLREFLPGVPWAATVGVLCVALLPLFGFMSGTLNPDTMLYTVSAAVFLCLARGFRRGLTRRLAIAIGLLIAVGFATKLNFVGLAFGVFAGLILLGAREVKSRGLEALLSLAIAAGIGSAPVVLYGLVNILSNHPTLGIASGSIAGFTSSSTFHEISYVWQLYLPRLPGMTHYFRGVSTYRDIWFDHFVGLYGWGDTLFPNWVGKIALVPAGAIAFLCGRMLVIRRHALRARLPELAIYAAISLGVLIMVGLASYNADVVAQDEAYGDPRYLLPMLPLLAAVLTLAVRGAGRRLAPVVGAVMVVLFLSHDVFSQLQVIARYYG